MGFFSTDICGPFISRVRPKLPQFRNRHSPWKEAKEKENVMPIGLHLMKQKLGCRYRWVSFNPNMDDPNSQSYGSVMC